jgi:hypothetical protein
MCDMISTQYQMLARREYDNDNTDTKYLKQMVPQTKFRFKK